MIKFRDVIKISKEEGRREKVSAPPPPSPKPKEPSREVQPVEERPTPREEPPHRPPPPPPPQPPPEPPRRFEREPEAKRERLWEDEFPKIAKPEYEGPPSEKSSIMGKLSALDVYNDINAFMHDLVERVRKKEDVNGRSVVQKVENLLDELARSSVDVGVLSEFDTPENYPIGHMIGVCIVSLQVGIELGFDRKKLESLGVGALLFDIGMIKVLDVVKQERKLGPLEYDEVKKHPEYGAKILERFHDLPKTAIEIALQHHERVDGKGYPSGLHGKKISELAKIVSLVDVFSAMVHSRPERPARSRHEAIKELMLNASNFSPKALRALLRIISIYPVGTWVELNSREIGSVIKVNHEQTLRPVVELVCDHRGHLLDEKSVMDLSRHPQLFITGVVSRENVKKWGLDQLGPQDDSI